MAYNEFLADRISQILTDKSVNFFEKKMFGGLCFMIDDKMCLGIVKDEVMARIGPEKYEQSLLKNGCSEMNFTGRPMKGYVFITPNGFDLDDDLTAWLQLCIDFNPIAKKSKKKKKKNK